MLGNARVKSYIDAKTTKHPPPPDRYKKERTHCRRFKRKRDFSNSNRGGSDCAKRGVGLR